MVMSNFAKTSGRGLSPPPPSSNAYGLYRYNCDKGFTLLVFEKFISRLSRDCNEGGPYHRNVYQQIGKGILNALIKYFNKNMLFVS